MEILLQDLLPGQEYQIQLRSKNQTGTSQWSRAYSITTDSDITAPSPATGLTWVVSGTSFVGEWTPPTTDSDAGPLRDFRDFKVTLTASATDVVFYVTEPRFDLSLSRNISSWGGPKPTVAIKVEVRDTVGNLSISVTASATNAVPSDVSNFDSTSALGGVNLTWDNVADNDLKQYEIYVGGSSGFTPGPSNLKVVTTSNAVFYATSITTLQYFKIRAVDAFDQGSANYTLESQLAYPLDGVPDSTAPSQPSAPTVSTGALVAQVSHAMTKQAGGNLEADVDYLEIHASVTTGFTPSSSTLRGTIDSAGVGITVSAAFYFPTTDSMTNLYWKVIAVDRSKNKSSASNQTTGLPGLILNANILNATITDAKIQDLSAAKLQAGTAIINDLFIESNITLSDVGTIESENFVAGTSGWQITAAGAAEFNNIIVRGELYVDGTDGFSYVRVYPLSGLPAIEWSAPSGAIWESYATEISGQEFMKIQNDAGFFMFSGSDTGIGLTQNNLGAPGVYFDANDGFLYRVSGFFPVDKETWTTLSLSNSWVSDGSNTAQYRLDADGSVYLRGRIKDGTGTNGTVFATLPSGYRPGIVHGVGTINPAVLTNQQVLVGTNGNMQIYNVGGANWIDLGGVTPFKIAAIA